MLQSSLLDEGHRAVLSAATGREEDALASYRAWRAATPLDDIDHSVYRVMPLLIDLVRRSGIEDPDIARMKGVVRHIWTSNVLRLRLLFAALDPLEAVGIRPMLLKGAALLARHPAIARKRTFADFDILVPPNTIGEAARALRAAGFSLSSFEWSDFEEELPTSHTAGVPLSMQGQSGELDLHWRPVSNIHDPTLLEHFFAAAEEAELQGRRVLVPSMPHHLFTSIARCEPWDKAESFNRLMEGYFLLSQCEGPCDWTEVMALLEGYGLEAAAHDYLGALITNSTIAVPRFVVARLNECLSQPKLKEWRLRAVPPWRRKPLQSWFLERADVWHERAGPAMPPLSRKEAALMQICRAPETVHKIWGLARDRFHGASIGKPRFLRGFSFPEAAGRWTNEHWAFLAIPLNESQGSGEPVRLNASVYRGDRPKTRVIATAGAGACEDVISNGWTANLAFAAVPQPQLGGDALVVLWLPDAISPFDAGTSQDRRMLGVFVERTWQR